jgi:hypothetical protein
MPQPDVVLFRVVLEKTRNELDPRFIAVVAERTKTCILDLLAIVGYQAQARLTVGQSGKDWHLTVLVERNLLAQLDLFSSRGQIPTVAQAAREVIEAALVALARFRREVGGIAAATLEQTLKQLRSADPRVIAAIARQRNKTLTIRHDGMDLELSVQSDSNRTVSSEPETLRGVIVGVGYSDLFVLPSNRRSIQHLCLHPVRIRIPQGLRNRLDPISVLKSFVKPRVPVLVLVQAEVVVRKRQQLTYLLVDWPPA